MANLKETIIGTMKNGPEVLQDIVSARKSGKDYITQRFQTKTVTDRLHPDKLVLQIIEIRSVTPGAKTIRFISKNAPLPFFEAGQYINIFTEIDGVRTSRPYSISSSPMQRSYFEITVARITCGFVSDFLLDSAKVGDVFESSGPAGVFHYNPVFHKKHSVFLAGGSGITPFMSMLEEALNGNADREITLIYGTRNAETAIFDAQLTNFAALHDNFHYYPVLSDPPAGYTGLTGFLDAACIQKLVPDISACTFYLCGPLVMTDYCSAALAELGVKPNHIRREMFGARTEIQKEAGWPSHLTGEEIFTVKIGDKIISALAKESLLTALERAGVRVNVCCRSGECSLCRVRLIEGTVFMPRGVLLRLADEKFGFIHSCQAYPTSNLTIEL